MIDHTQAHLSVLKNEAIAGLAINQDGCYVDATFGRGGHSKTILKHLSGHGKLIAFDRDLEAIEYAHRSFEDARFRIIHKPFSQMLNELTEIGVSGKIDGLLMDIGVSSPQIDDANRGFSFMHDGPLDMRMDQSQGQSAADWLNGASEEDIAWVLRNYGEEKFAKRIARAIIDYRQSSLVKNTLELARIIEKATPVKDKYKHPATRSFQAIRIYINAELEELESVLRDCYHILKSGGRLAIISFHSLEDRLVKRFLKASSQGKKVPARLPITQREIDDSKRFKLIGRAVKASDQEVAANPRARSAVLRVAEKV